MDPLTHPRKMPAQKLTDRVDLVIVTAMRQAGYLGPKILKPRRPLGQPHMPSFNAGGLRIQMGYLVTPCHAPCCAYAKVMLFVRL
jgi:hypothetical protein